MFTAKLCVICTVETDEIVISLNKNQHLYEGGIENHIRNQTSD